MSTDADPNIQQGCQPRRFGAAFIVGHGPLHVTKTERGVALGLRVAPGCRHPLGLCRGGMTAALRDAPPPGAVQGPRVRAAASLCRSRSTPTVSPRRTRQRRLRAQPPLRRHGDGAAAATLKGARACRCC
jgi:hypothetical protein